MNTITAQMYQNKDKTDTGQLKSIYEQRRQHIDEHQVSVIAGLLLALEPKSNYQ